MAKIMQTLWFDTKEPPSKSYYWIKPTGNNTFKALVYGNSGWETVAETSDVTTLTPEEYEHIEKDPLTLYAVTSSESDTASLYLGEKPIISSDTGAYHKPATGIPATDLEESVQTSLGKADTALQSQVQGDWNQNNSSATDYIKNRTHYDSSAAYGQLIIDRTSNPDDTFDNMVFDVMLKATRPGHTEEFHIPIAGSTSGDKWYTVDNALIILADPESYPSEEPLDGTFIVELYYDSESVSVFGGIQSGITIFNGSFELNSTFPISVVGYGAEVELEELVPLDEKYIPQSIKDGAAAGATALQSQTQVDWNQNTDTAVDYIKNRTHYEIPGQTYTSAYLPAGLSSPIRLGDENGPEFTVIDDYTQKIGPVIINDKEEFIFAEFYGDSVMFAYGDNATSLPGFLAHSTWDRLSSLTVTFSKSASYGYTLIRLKNKYLNVDSVPTEGSEKLVESGGVWDKLYRKQDKLDSGVNIKTINNTSILGSGNIATPEDFPVTYGETPVSQMIAAFNAGKNVYCLNGTMKYTMTRALDGKALLSATDLGLLTRIMVTRNDEWYKAEYFAEHSDNKVSSLSQSSTYEQYPSAKCVYDALSNKQDTLVSGTNIKSINNMSLLGSGDITIEGGGGSADTSNCVKIEAQTFTDAEKTIARTNIGAGTGTSNFSGSYTDLTDKPAIPTTLASLSDDSTHRVVTDSEKSTWNNKSDFSGSYTDLTNKPTIPAAQIQSDWNQSDNAALDFIKNKPTIPSVSGLETTSNKVTSLSSSSTNDQYASAKATYDEIHPATASSQPAGGMLPNVLYNLGTLTGSVTFTLAAPADANVVNHYYWTFDTSSTAPTVTWPAGITSWIGGSAPTINASKHYEVSVLNGVGVYFEV